MVAVTPIITATKIIFKTTCFFIYNLSSYTRIKDYEIGYEGIKNFNVFYFNENNFLA